MTKQDKSHNCCEECPEPCCSAVKHLPYQGECSAALFSRMLIGAFPDIDKGPAEHSPDRRPFVAEWLVPAEVKSCPAFREDGRCDIYEHRPLACRQFPMYSSGKVHPFCSLPENFSSCTYRAGPFSTVSDMLDGHLCRILKQSGERALSHFLMEDDACATPLLYNSYLVMILSLAGCGVMECLAAQETVISAYRDAGCGKLTFIVPGTEYCIGASPDELSLNLQYLMARLEQQDMELKIKERLREIFP